MPSSISSEPKVETDPLTTQDISKDFETLVNSADTNVQTFITKHTGTDGTLNLSTADSMRLQQLMADQSIAAQTGASSIKTIKDSIMASARSI